MTEFESIQPSEELEASQKSDSSRELDEATNEPGTRVEQIGSVEQSEKIESAITELMDTQAELNHPDDDSAEISDPIMEAVTDPPEGETRENTKE